MFRFLKSQEKGLVTKFGRENGNGRQFQLKDTFLDSRS